MPRLKSELVFKWMSPEPITVTPDTCVSEAKTLLDDYHIRRLPVVDHEGHLIGIVTRGDIRAALPSEAESLGEWELNYLVPRITVKHVMTPNPITAYTTDTIVWAATLMLQHKISGLPVVTPADRQLVGIITESDIFALVVQNWEEEVSYQAK